MRPSIDIGMAVGFGCLCAWGQILTAFTFSVSTNVPLSPLIALLLASWLLALVKPVRAWVLRWLPSNARGLVATIAAATAAGCVLALAPAMPLAVAYAMAVAAGFGASALFLIWAVTLSRLDSHQRFGTALASLLVFGAVQAVSALLPDAGMPVAAVVCAAVSVGVAIAIGRRRAQSGAEAAAAHSEGGLVLAVRSFKRFFGAYFIYAFVFGVTFGVSAFYYTIRSGEVQSIVAGSAPGCLVGACVLLAVYAIWGDRFNLKALSQVISPILAVLFLLHMLFEDWFSTELVNATFSLWWIVSVFLFLTLVDVAFQGSVGHPGVFATGWALVQTGLAGGGGLAQVASFFFGEASITANVITACSLVLVVVATAMLVGAATPFDHAAAGAEHSGEGAPGAGEEAEGSGEDLVLGICRRIARKHDLTAREEEVLVLLAQGHTRNGIANKLVVSDNTVRAHVKSIYHKLHIHSKQELVDIIDGYRSIE